MQIKTFLKVGLLAIFPLTALADWRAVATPMPAAQMSLDHITLVSFDESHSGATRAGPNMTDTSATMIGSAMSAVMSKWSMRRPEMLGSKYLVMQWREI